jgi:hypothetical protein
MYDLIKPFQPFRVFLMLFLPVASTATLLAVLAQYTAPALAPAMALSLGFLGFLFAVDGAASGKIFGFMMLEHSPPINRVLAMRKNRLWHAFSFSATGVAFLVLVPAGIKMLGMAPPLAMSFGHCLLVAAILVTSAWVVIGEAACSQTAIRRALRGIHIGQ